MFPTKIEVLDFEMFPTGHMYFAERIFAGDSPCHDCVLIHNNNANRSNNNKVYRFKEHLLWFVDTNGYYSSEISRYISFSNIYDYGPDTTIWQEKRALENALFLGHILNRIVILPKLYCYACKGRYFTYPIKFEGKPHCAAQFHYNIEQLDKMFDGRYREHVFLDNPMVPNSIKHSVSPVILLYNPAKLQHNLLEQKVTFQSDHVPSTAEHQLPLCDATILPNCSLSPPFDVATNPVKTETLKAWLETFSHYSVLRFQHLYGKIVDLDSDPDFKRKLEKGIILQSWQLESLGSTAKEQQINWVNASQSQNLWADSSHWHHSLCDLLWSCMSHTMWLPIMLCSKDLFFSLFSGYPWTWASYIWSWVSGRHKNNHFEMVWYMFSLSLKIANKFQKWELKEICEHFWGVKVLESIICEDFILFVLFFSLVSVVLMTTYERTCWMPFIFACKEMYHEEFIKKNSLPLKQNQTNVCLFCHQYAQQRLWLTWDCFQNVPVSSRSRKDQKRSFQTAGLVVSCVMVSMSALFFS